MNRDRLIYSCLPSLKKIGIDSELPGISSIGLDVYVNRQGEVYVTISEPKLSSLEHGVSIGVSTNESLPGEISSFLADVSSNCRALSEELMSKAALFDKERVKLEAKEGNRGHLIGTEAEREREMGKEVAVQRPVLPLKVVESAKPPKVHTKRDLDMFT